jgi:hypothetical protein
LTYSLLDPHLERYGFVLSDALDSRLEKPRSAPLVEVGWLWQPGEAQPAWVELLRSRRFLVESDGAGFIRACVPWNGAAATSSEAAAAEAWSQAWPVLRHVLAAERLRLTAAGRREPLSIEVHPYVHEAARSRFLLGLTPHRIEHADSKSDGTRPPLDLVAWRGFLRQGLQLEGARIDAGGRIHLFGSKPEASPSLLGRPLSLADLAVAYRAVFRGGLAEPYMSLDRGYSPWMSTVNYGGRLRDTALGMVSLLCDIRFKTFSMGLDILSGADMRPVVRKTLPGFRTHIERFAADPKAAGVMSQQTRLWFYPDNVDLTLSPQGDVLVLRRVRMSAASERMELTQGGASGKAGDAPWTLATVAAINGEYDELASYFPELTDLDQVVRLLSLFAWLKQVETDGLLIPDLDALLAVELPALYTPRAFPQLLAFNALPGTPADNAVTVFDRVPVAESLERLNPPDHQRLPARRKLDRALAALDRRDPANASLFGEIGKYDVADLDDSMLDFFAHRAERLRMHQTVLRTLGGNDREQVDVRREQDPALRAFSIAIGGLDLGMGQAVARASARNLSFAGFGPGAATTGAGSDVAATETARRAVDEKPRAVWRVEPEPSSMSPLPAHGLGVQSAAPRAKQDHDWGWIERDARRVAIVSSANGAEPLSVTRSVTDDDRLARVDRVELLYRSHYEIEASEFGFTARARSEPAADGEALASAQLPAGLATLFVGGGESFDPATATPRVRVRLSATPEGEPRNMEADFPRIVLQRLVMGRALDPFPEQPMPISPLPPALGPVSSLMVLYDARHRARPWEPQWRVAPGEEDPQYLARAAKNWVAETGDADGPPAVVGTDPAASPQRWTAAPRPRGPALLLLPAGAVPDAKRRSLAREWKVGPTAEALPERLPGNVIVLVSAEPPGPLGDRLHRLAEDRRLAGSYLAVWSLSGPIRGDLAPSLVGAGNLAALGLAEATVVRWRAADAELASFDSAVGAVAETPHRIEHLAGPFLWHF